VTDIRSPNQIKFVCDICGRSLIARTTNFQLAIKGLKKYGWGAQPSSSTTYRHLCRQHYDEHKAEVNLRRQQRKQGG
jgi:hypothetical protein